MLTRLRKLVEYNRDWPLYLSCRFRSQSDDDLLTFRLRNGQKIRTRPSVRFNLNEIYLDHAYDVPGVNIASSETILDLGANVGVFTLYCSALAPRARIFSVEPSSTNFAILSENVKTNSARATLYHLAVAGENGRGFLAPPGQASDYMLGAEGPSSEVVECIDLASMFELAGVDSFDFVKMDVEGVERQIFAQASDDLLRRIKALSLEWHHSMEELGVLEQRMQRLGFVTERQFLPVNVRYLKARQNNVPAR